MTLKICFHDIENMFFSCESSGLIPSGRAPSPLVWYCQFDVSSINYSDSDSQVTLSRLLSDGAHICIGQRQDQSIPLEDEVETTCFCLEFTAL